jgi:hypothetical protein
MKEPASWRLSCISHIKSGTMKWCPLYWQTLMWDFCACRLTVRATTDSLYNPSPFQFIILSHLHIRCCKQIRTLLNKVRMIHIPRETENAHWYLYNLLYTPCDRNTKWMHRLHYLPNYLMNFDQIWHACKQICHENISSDTSVNCSPYFTQSWNKLYWLYQRTVRRAKLITYMKYSSHYIPAKIIWYILGLHLTI